MTFQRANSSSLDLVGYRDGHLEVLFTSDRLRDQRTVYVYRVPVEVYTALLAADSRGSYFAGCIRRLPFRTKTVVASSIVVGEDVHA